MRSIERDIVLSRKKIIRWKHNSNILENNWRFFRNHMKVDNHNIISYMRDISFFFKNSISSASSIISFKIDWSKYINRIWCTNNVYRIMKIIVIERLNLFKKRRIRWRKHCRRKLLRNRKRFKSWISIFTRLKIRIRVWRKKWPNCFLREIVRNKSSWNRSLKYLMKGQIVYVYLWLKLRLLKILYSSNRNLTKTRYKMLEESQLQSKKI